MSQDPEVELNHPVDGSVYRGLAGVRAYFRDRDSKLWRLRIYATKSEAREAAGLSEK